MSKISISSNPSGTATYTITAPAGSTDRTLTLPDAAGAVVIDEAGGGSVKIDSNGNMGIGTSNPNKSSSNLAFTLNAASGQYAAIELSTGDTGRWYINADATNVYDTAMNNTNRVFSTGGSERMRIDSAGRVTMPYQPAFYTSIDYDDGGYVTNYDYTWLNRGSHFNATTGLFTAPVAGVYAFAATIMSGADASYAWWRFSINGTLTGGIYHTHSNSSESYRTLSGNAVFQLSQNDTVGVYIGVNTVYSSGPNPWSSFSGYLLG